MYILFQFVTERRRNQNHCSPDKCHSLQDYLFDNVYLMYDDFTLSDIYH